MFACRFIWNEEISARSTNKGVIMIITKAHGVLGHIHEDAVRQMAKHIDIKITHGKLAPCKDCAKSKAKQNNVSKESTSKKANEVCEQVYLDLSKVIVHKTDEAAFKIKQKYWRSIVDEKTGNKWCGFTATRKETPEQMCQWLNSMKSRGFKVKVIRLDPAGENEKEPTHEPSILRLG